VSVEGRVVECLVAVAGGVRGVVHEDRRQAEPLGHRVQQLFRGFGEGEVQLHRLRPNARSE
jgi:hypothetical protein